MCMKYTYRYSREPTITISWVCPICRVKTTITHEEDIYPKRFITTSQLCCCEAHTKIYEKRIKQAIAWSTNKKWSKVSVSKYHYNAFYTDGESKYTTVASVLANLGEYFPFTPERDSKKSTS